MIRHAALVGLLLAGCTTNPCKQKTAFVTFKLLDGISADTLDVALSVSGAAEQHGAAKALASGSIQVDFASGYTVGASFRVTLTASQGGTVVGSGSAETTLVSGCTTLHVDVHATSVTSDLALDLSEAGLVDAAEGDLPKVPQGMQCGVGTQCESGLFCVDGVCCDTACTAQCYACNVAGAVGVCTPEPNGTVCGTGFCDTGTDFFTPVPRCNGAGTCTATAGYSCAPFKCQDATQCRLSCTDSAMHCTSGNSCVNNSCGTLPIGRDCTMGPQCTSGNCVDSVCCDGTCGQQCQACDIPDGMAKLGTCTTVQTGAPHGTRTACTNNSPGCGGACGGNPAQCNYPTGACGTPAGCTSGMQTNAVTCNLGSCPTQTPISCAQGICGNTTCATVKKIATGDRASYALLSDNYVKSWGDNSWGQLGYPSAGEDQPRLIPGLFPVKDIAAGADNACAVMMDDTMRCWGGNMNGQLGIGITEGGPHSTPSTVVTSGGPALSQVGTATVGNLNTCAVLTTGKLSCWGWNSLGTVGNGGTSMSVVNPATVCAIGGCGNGLSMVAQAAAGDGFVCARLTTGEVDCWGANDSGSLGIGTTDGTPTAHSLPLNTNLGVGNTAIDLAAMNRTACAVLQDGAVRCWGISQDGSLGRGSLPDGPYPSPLPVCTASNCSTTLIGASSVDIGINHACVIQAGGSVLCWGANDQNQLSGVGGTQSFAGITALGSQAVQISVGLEYGCARINDGITNGFMKCWGANFAGQLGVNDMSNRTTPTSVVW